MFKVTFIHSRCGGPVGPPPQAAFRTRSYHFGAQPPRGPSAVLMLRRQTPGCPGGKQLPPLCGGTPPPKTCHSPLSAHDTSVERLDSVGLYFQTSNLYDGEYGSRTTHGGV